jgi:hypothetical protein
MAGAGILVKAEPYAAGSSLRRRFARRGCGKVGRMGAGRWRSRVERLREMRCVARRPGDVVAVHSALETLARLGFRRRASSGPAMWSPCVRPSKRSRVSRLRRRASPAPSFSLRSKSTSPSLRLVEARGAGVARRWRKRRQRASLRVDSRDAPLSHRDEAPSKRVRAHPGSGWARGTQHIRCWRPAASRRPAPGRSYFFFAAGFLAGAAFFAGAFFAAGFAAAFFTGFLAVAILSLLDGPSDESRMSLRPISLSASLGKNDSANLSYTI